MSSSRAHYLKGVSEAIASLIAFTLVALFLLGIHYMMLSYVFSTPRVPQIDLAEEYVNVDVEAKDFGNGNYTFVNRGSIPVSIDVALLRTTLLNVDKVCSGSKIIQPGGETKLLCPTGIDAFIARVGDKFNNVRVIYPEKPYYPVVLKAINMTPLLTWNTVAAMAKYFEDSSIIKRGAINTSLRLDLYLNTSGNIKATLNSVALAIVTKTQSNKYNIIIVGNRTSGSATNSIEIGGKSYDLSKAGYYRYRIKILNFSGTISVDGSTVEKGIYPCLVNTDKPCRLDITGYADRVLIYTNSTSTGYGVVGLDPFYTVGDLDGNGYPEFIFVTQDFTVGDSNKINDRVDTRRNIYAIDATVNPLRIVFRDIAIDSSKYSNVIVSVRLFYWDNSLDDIDENDNRVVVRVGIYDYQSKSFAYTTSLSYYELCRYRSVKPFQASYIVKDFLLYVPPNPSGKIYYVAIEIVDPYMGEGTENDTDIIFGIEYVGVVLGVR